MSKYEHYYITTRNFVIVIIGVAAALTLMKGC